MVECARLEIVLRRNTYGGSNPLLCANLYPNAVAFFKFERSDIYFNIFSLKLFTLFPLFVKITLTNLYCRRNLYEKSF